MKRLIIYLFIYLCILGGLIRCDDREKYFEGNNSAPSIILHTLEKSGNILTDSIKLSGTAGLFFYEVGVKIEDLNGNIELVTIDTITNTPKLLVQSDSILIDIKLVDIHSTEDSIVLQIGVFEEGIYPLKFIIIDLFGRKETAILELTVFNNLPPVVKYELKTSDLSSDIRIIDLSSSYDRDLQYGGKIVLYNYELDGKKFTVTEGKFTYSFPGVGSYPVTVSVTDNNIVNSEVKNFTIVIP